MANSKFANQERNRNAASIRSSRRRRKSYIPSLIARLLGLAVLLAFTSVLCYAALSNVGRPYILGAQQSSEISEKTQNLRQLEIANQKLAQQCAYLNRPDGIEYEARLKGFLMPGERSLVLTPAPGSAPQ